MYIPAQNFKEEQPVEIFCRETGEAYVWVDGDDKSLLPPELLPGAIDRLPNRFHQPQGYCTRHNTPQGSQVRFLFIPRTPEPIP